MKTDDKRGRTWLNGLAAFLSLLIGWCIAGEAFPYQAGRRPSPLEQARLDIGAPGHRPGQEDSGGSPPPLKTDTLPANGHGTWLAASPALLGFDPEHLESALADIGRMDGIYSFILVRNGFLAAEQYFREGHRTKPHNLKSASKSVLSALIGVAVQEGLLHLDVPVCDIIPGSKRNDDSRKAEITVRHLLTMTSGLEPTSYRAYNSWVLNGDWVKSALDRPLVADPGTRFQYSTGNTHLLSAVLTAATGMSTKAYANRKLFEPMAITIHGWDTDPKGIYQGGNNLLLVPRDMARIGQLYLDRGKYGERQLIPEAWVDESTRPGRFGKNEVYGSYGYLWYCNPDGHDAYVAVGFGGQYIYISREYNCVIVVTATLTSKGREWERRLFALIHGDVFGAVRSQPAAAMIQVAGREDPRPMASRHSTVSTGEGPPPQVYPISRTTRNVVLRQRPSRQSKRLGLVPAGTRVDILETTGRWHRIRHKGTGGWLFSPYVNIFLSEAPDASPEAGKFITYESSQSVPSPTLPAAPRQSREGMSRKGQAAVRLNLRAGPSRSDSVVRILDAGTPLDLEETIGSWHRVRSGPYDGWVWGDYVTLLPVERPALASRGEESPGDAGPKVETLHDGPPKTTAPTDSRQGIPGPLLPDVADELASLTSQLRKSASTRRHFEQALAHLEEKVAKQLRDSASREERHKSLLSEVSDMKHALKQQEQASQLAHSARESLRSDMVRLGRTVAAANEIISREQGLRERRDGEVSALNRALLGQQAAGSRSEAERKRLATDLAAARAQIATLASALSESKVAREKLSTALSVVEKAQTEQRINTRGETGRWDAAANELTETRDRLQSVEKAIDTVQRDRDQQKTEIAALRQAFRSQSEVTAQTGKERNALADAFAAARKKIKSLQTAAEKETASRMALEAEMSKVKGALEELRLGDEASKADRGALASAIDGNDTRIAAMKERLLSVIAAKDKADAALGALSRETAMQKEALAQSASERSRMESEWRSASVQLDALKQKQGDESSAREALSEGLAELKQRLSVQRQAGDQVKATEKSLIAEQVWVRKRIAQIADGLEAENVRRKDPVGPGGDAASTDRALAERSRISADVSGMQKQLASYQLALKDADARQKALATDVSAMRETLAAQTREIRAADSEQQKETVLIRQMQRRVQALGRRFDTSEGSREQLKADIAGLRDESLSQREGGSRLETEQEGIRSAVSAAQRQMASLQEALGESENTTVALQAEVSASTQDLEKRLAGALSASKKERESIASELSNVREILGEQQRTAHAADDTRKALLAQLDGLGVRVAALRETLGRIRSVGDGRTAGLAALKRELKLLNKRSDRIESENNRLAAMLRGTERREEEHQPRIQIQSQGAQTQGPAPSPEAGLEKEASLSTSPDFDSIETFAISWAEAWQNKHVERYLAHYAQDFQPPGGVEAAQWRRQRRKRILKPAFIKIDLKNIQTRITGPSHARLTFDQRYRSSTYNDDVVKSLSLRWEADGWRITGETSR